MKQHMRSPRALGMRGGRALHAESSCSPAKATLPGERVAPEGSGCSPAQEGRGPQEGVSSKSPGAL